MPPRVTSKTPPEMADTTKKIVDLLVKHPDADRRKILDAVRALIAQAPSQLYEEVFGRPRPGVTV